MKQLGSNLPVPASTPFGALTSHSQGIVSNNQFFPLERLLGDAVVVSCAAYLRVAKTIA